MTACLRRLWSLIWSDVVSVCLFVCLSVFIDAVLEIQLPQRHTDRQTDRHTIRHVRLTLVRQRIPLLLVGAYARGPVFCWVHCQHAQNGGALHDLPASQSDSTQLKLTLTLTLSTPWMQAYLMTNVRKFGGDPVICLREKAIYSADRQTDTRQTRLTTSQTHSTQL